MWTTSVPVHDEFSLFDIAKRLLPIGGHNCRPMLQQWGLVYTLWSLVFTGLLLLFVTAFYTKQR